jgi:hypothetical protein
MNMMASVQWGGGKSVTNTGTSDNLVYYMNMSMSSAQTWPNTGTIGGNGIGNVINNTTNYKSAPSSAQSGSGTTDRITLPGSISYVPSTGLTICFWVRPEAVVFQHSWVHLRKSNTSNVVVAEFAIFSQAGNQTFSVRGSMDGFNQIISSNMTWSVNTWYHVAAVILPYNASNTNFCKLYVNGAEVTIQTPKNTVTYVATTLEYNTIFKSVDYSQARASIDELRVYTRNLTSAEITSIYNQHSSSGV